LEAAGVTASRRDLLLAAACVATAGAAAALTPRRRVSLMGASHLEAIAPIRVGRWSGRDVTDLVAPKTEDSLESRLYNQTLERIYEDGSGAQIMVLLAHGDTPNNELQLHRPETCYPAFGFQILSAAVRPLPLAPRAPLPVRELVASAPGRQENIVYWTRLGEYLPTSEGQQRADRVKIALHGEIADGLLARFSLVSTETDPSFAMLREFIAAFVTGVARPRRPALVGTSLSSAMSVAGV
jgi:EpsI family protein